MASTRMRCRIAAALYVVTWVTSVAAVILYGGSTMNPTSTLAGRVPVLAAGVLEVILAVAVVGTAVALYPVLRGYEGGSAMAYVALRTLEAGVILVGVVAILPAVARPGTRAAAALDSDVVAGLHLMHDWAFVVGPGLINPVNAIVLAVVLWRWSLVPAFIPVLGMVGAVLVAGMNVAVVFGFTDPLPLLAIPLFAWEICLAAALVIRGIPRYRRGGSSRRGSAREGDRNREMTAR
jgi:hypothetical protein